jgi:SNF2 family DNA or RNA helicase
MIVVEIFRYRRRVDNIGRCLVLCPTVGGVETWRKLASKHAPGMRFGSTEELAGEKARRDAICNKKLDLVATTYMGWLGLVADKTREKRSKRHRWGIDAEKLRELSRCFDMVIYDEASVMGNNLSLFFRVARQMRKYIKIRYGLTGTPFGRDPSALWSEFYVIDSGDALGPTKGLFQQVFFTRKKRFWGGFDYTFRKPRSRELYRMMAHSSIRFADRHCVDLPKRRMLRRPVVLSDEAEEYYERVVSSWRQQGNGIEEMQSLYMRARQIASGYLSGRDEAGDRHYVRLPNPKLDTLLEVLDEIGPREKVVIFHEFIYSGNWLSEVLEHEKVPYARLYSKTRHKGREIRRFISDPECRVFLVNSSSGAFSVDGLQDCARYAIFYELPADARVRRQAIKRLHRTGQTRRTYIIDIYVLGGVEEKLRTYLKHGRDLFRALVDGEDSL